MFSFFKRSSAIKPDLSFIGVDMHSHLLPGLDDGLQDIDTTLAFIEQLHELGYNKLICTPHILSDIYPNSPVTILPTLKAVQDAIAERQIPVIVEAAAEYMVDPEMENNMKKGQPLLTFGKNLILIEMSYVAASPNIEQVIFALRLKGLTPVIAHPERYNFYHSNFDQYERLIDLGCILQANLLSLLGYYGKPVKQVVEKLFAKKMIRLVGTDMHHQIHLNALKDLAMKPDICKLLKKAELENSQLL